MVRRDRSPAVAIDHDAQLSDDPELLNAAGAVALLAAENASSTRAGTSAVQELERHVRDSSEPATPNDARSNRTFTTAFSNG